MSEIVLNINVDSYNKEGIKTIKGNNNAEIYKLYILKNKRRLNLTGKTIKLGYVMAGTTKGDIIENLNITNAEQGEITFPITNRISKQDGVYSCQLAIYGADGFLEHTATFGLTVEANIFTKIAGEIENSKDFTYIERILEEAKTVSGDLKTNIPVATNLNSSLESNISNARNINTTLADTTEKSKVAATDAIEKKSQLEKSITKAKEFIDGLDESQNIPGIRMELTELQNGLKSNQALEYSGSSISANDTLEGRTEGMRIKGKTLLNIHSKSNYSFATSIPQENYTLSEGQNFCEVTIKKYPSSSYYYINAGTINFDLLKPNQKYTLLAKATDGLYPSVMTGGYEFPLTSGGTSFKNGVATMTTNNLVNGSKGQILYINLNGGATYKQELRDVMIFEGDLSIIPCSYFEGIKSFGEAEQEGDKYKISILSSGKNFFKSYKSKSKGNTSIFNIENDNVTIGTNQSPSWTNASINYGKLKIGSKYTVSCEGFSGGVGDKVLFAVKKYKGRDEVGAYGDINKNSLSLTFTVVDDADIVLRFFVNNTTPINTPTSITYNNIQIVEGIKTNYAPSIIDKKDILISAPLRSVYDVQDIMYEDNGQVKVNRVIGEHLVTGDENFITELRNDYLYGYFTLEGSKAGSGLEAICNQFKYIDGLWNKDNLNVQGKEGFDLSGSNSLSFQLPISKLETADTSGLKKYFKNLYNSNNPVIVYYQLATPTIEIVENCVDIDLDTYQEKTYFNILNSLPGTLDFKVPSNIGSSLQNLAKEVNNIWDVINNLLVPSIVKANGNIAMIKLNNNLK
ncbi:BppU family phage baseplate upper protein [Clostridium perfringens]|uniref:BppU family phage baseplate upper protein n=2 Tax=Clostridium perfringens TaxID=1502 RepID=A0AAW4J266_CLOPF|nr:BppU family phage baseplate upper protein [Clostridium perfringens]MBO3342673.1 BppU family phage baseplate upper protein [Clostridium perfringens]MBO3345746.1 BppU family phage baseplate upper protein [Clostridium perfringens]MBO3348818.1 BppU family phage baseplate upper protein [Clostridium perfringens]MBO3354719.1 BppU family phage baseplate upper protein [Clostridium perfringens]MBO3357989.1 BppU family phage baseplate upper protein [Clostridium perfringens]